MIYTVGSGYGAILVPGGGKWPYFSTAGQQVLFPIALFKMAFILQGSFPGD